MIQKDQFEISPLSVNESFIINSKGRAEASNNQF